jgi:UDP-N-acetylglucosamine 1-carboxyvinyltransferase
MLLADGPSLLRNVPALRDIATTSALLRFLGCEVTVDTTKHEVAIASTKLARLEAPYELVKQMRASVLVLGPMLARHGRAKVSLPGGCAIGARPIDQHLKGLTAMGVKYSLERGYVNAEGPATPGAGKGGGRLHGADFRFDMITVTGTENLLMAAALAKGRTTLFNCALEPEVEELARVLNKMGAKIDGAGTPTIHIEGVDQLGPADHAIIADRIEAGTYVVAGAMVPGSDVLVEGANLEDMMTLVNKLHDAGVSIERVGSALRVRRAGALKAIDVDTEPHPGFPTDMQAQFMVLMTQAEGAANIRETIFENRFMHVPELMRMGANIETHGNHAIVRGPTALEGASVMATDLRASASLVLAGLVAGGETEIRRVYHLDRGYEQMEVRLRALGADCERVKNAEG